MSWISFLLGFIVALLIVGGIFLYRAWRFNRRLDFWGF